MSTSILLHNPKFVHNIGSAVRASSCFGGGPVYWTGDRVDLAGRLPREERMKGYQDAPWQQLHTPRPIDQICKKNQKLIPVAIELVPSSESLNTFVHPADALYVFGPEDGSLPKGIRNVCHRFVTIPSYHCLNLAAAVYVVLYDRTVKHSMLGLQELPTVNAEGRGSFHTTQAESGSFDE